ncbi:FadD3 family acyl-CoA ligase [Lentzea flaviverrucosa]|uniref:Acyl-CoA synthetase (AMP-forming)/AMP-acid ligase II n=1 Tax=Lentzea flaviverrucosa TaxID=200379 RepID=A0A1H9CPH1_9PSEU|nr:FadD3 family acyl-CoA ligase [Lentzea flaviverrucosa]RDI24605.1 acyl-CoA synthetase (AMP-forming)/AMP-acid ligase II [Lentzea flaviverrucosa]SEQ02957.1 Acyl-CoA synthetase (AMP-forming)/AMP-acid ligase II [Lentzea flaviverrucosa]
MADVPSRQTVSAVLDRAAASYIDAEALVDGEVRLTWLELRSAVLDAARALVGMGVQPGDRVALCAPNSAQWVVAALGALCAGAALVPINTRFTATETWDVVRRSAARVLVVEGEFLGRDREAELRALSPELPAVVRLPVEWLASDVDLPELAEDQLCDVMFTSGTTGRSKGAMSAHRQSLGVAEAWAACGELTSADRYLIVNPFFHTFGYKAGILACLMTGATIVPQPVFDVVETMRLIERERITVLPGPPTIFQALLDHPDRGSFDLSSLRLVVTGAAVVPVVLIERLRTELSLTVLTAYGLTEAVVATMCRPGDSPETVAHTCGAPMAGFELRLGERDEVLLRGPNVMLGYLDDPDATAAAIDADGWLHTGDVGVLDERGYLSITDRLKDMYICGGFNVYPAEVEQALARLPGVAESAVVGMADARLGEVGVAHVVTAPGSSLSADDVIAFCRERLANYKVPRAVEFHPALPRNAMGKVLKTQLRKENA